MKPRSRAAAAIAAAALLAATTAGCANATADSFTKAIKIIDRTTSDADAARIGQCAHAKAWDNLSEDARETFASGNITKKTLKSMNKKDQQTILEAALSCA